MESDPAYYLRYYNGAPAHNDSCEENATNYLRTQYNPLIIENMPPMLVKFSVRVEEGKLHYHIFIRDAGRIESVLINDETGSGYYVNNSVNAVVFEDNGTFTLSTSEQVFTVRIRVVAYDTATNKLDVSRDLHGPVGAIINCALRFLSALWRALVSAAQRVVQAVNIIGKWVEILIEDMMNTILGELTNALNSYLVEIVNGASLLIDEYNKTGQIDEEDTFKVMENALLPGWLVGLAIGGILMALMITLMSVTLGMSTLLSMAIGLVISLVVTETFKITEKEGFLPSGIDENMGVKEIINFIGLYLGFIKRDVRVNDHYQEGIWSVFSLLFAWLSVQSGMNAFAMAEADATGILSGTLAIAAGVLAFVVGLAALFALGFTHNWGVMTFLGLVALFFSIEGVVFSLLSLRGASGAVLVIGGIGFVLGLIGIYFSLKGLGVNIP